MPRLVLLAGLLFAGGDEFFAFRGGESESFTGVPGEFGFDERAGIAEQRFEFGSGEGVPALDGDPVGTGEIGSGNDALDFEELGTALRTGGEGEDGARVVLEAGEGEHFASDGLVANPEDEGCAPLHGFFDVRKGAEISVEEFDVHDGDRIAQPPIVEDCDEGNVQWGWVATGSLRLRSSHFQQFLRDPFANAAEFCCGPRRSSKSGVLQWAVWRTFQQKSR